MKTWTMEWCACTTPVLGTADNHCLSCRLPVRARDFPRESPPSLDFDDLCQSRGVDRAVVDFIRHNMSDTAALAALRAMPVNPPSRPSGGASDET